MLAQHDRATPMTLVQMRRRRNGGRCRRRSSSPAWSSWRSAALSGSVPIRCWWRLVRYMCRNRKTTATRITLTPADGTPGRARLTADAYATWRGWPSLVSLAAVLNGLALAAGLGHLLLVGRLRSAPTSSIGRS